MSKKNTPLQLHIKWLEKSLSECNPLAPAIPFIQMAINNAKSLLPAEREAIEGAILYALDEIAEFGHMGVSTASDYFTTTYNDSI